MRSRRSARRSSGDDAFVAANGWLEWRNEGSRKQPYVITADSDEPLSFAGLWERWDNDGEAIESFTILTTVASPALADLHHRQPAIIEADDFGEWLEPGTAPERLLALAQRAYEGPFDRWAVSRRVNNARNNDPDVLSSLALATPGLQARRLAGRSVICIERDRDRYGRIVAVCRVDGHDINAWMVSQGVAVAYRKYSRAYVGHGRSSPLPVPDDPDLFDPRVVTSFDPDG